VDTGIDATGGRACSRRMVSERASERLFVGASALVFAASAAATILRCASMASLGTRRMPGGWTMSMAWQRMPGQTWPGAAASFLGMWTVMMVAMMLPSLVPALWRYRRSIGTPDEPRLGVLTALAGAGYFFVWTAVGMAAFPLGTWFASLATQLPAVARAVPTAAGVAVVAAGAFQCSAWKARHLACWHEPPRPGRSLPRDAGSAWRHGLRLGIECVACSAGMTAILFATGLMNLRVMFVVTVTITLERLVPGAERAAQIIGAIVAGTGLVLIVRAL
jgi:predicted metal-binding membrane protein